MKRIDSDKLIRALDILHSKGLIGIGKTISKADINVFNSLIYSLTKTGLRNFELIKLNPNANSRIDIGTLVIAFIDHEKTAVIGVDKLIKKRGALVAGMQIREAAEYFKIAMLAYFEKNKNESIDPTTSK